MRSMTSSGWRTTMALVAATVLAAGCGGTQRFVAPAPLPDDRRDVPVSPPPRKYNVNTDAFDKQIPEQIEQSMDVARTARALVGRRKEALDVDAWDEVRDSAWFTNRNARRTMTIEDFARGPDTVTGPDTSAPWTVKRAKVEGVTTGFTIEDARGDRYLIKFDPVGYSELGSGAEMVSTRFFHAAGYHVPESFVVVFDPATLKLAADVPFTDAKGRKRNMTPADLTALLARAERRPDGTIRASAGKFLSGGLGPFRYEGTVDADPNDLVPHDYLRPLRGMYVLCAWLNHFDTKDGNSLDVYANEGGRRFVKHYVRDFGSTLGSAGLGPVKPDTGAKNKIDPHDIVLDFLGLGLRVHDWERKAPMRFPSVGLFESEHFDPLNYEPLIPNPAFERLTDRDGYWGAKLVTSFTNEQIEAAVAAGRYSDPEAARALVRTLIERRDKTGRAWFARIAPLDRFELAAAEQLRFADLAIERSLATTAETEYQVEFRREGESVRVSLPPMKPSTATSTITLPPIGATHQRVRRGDADSVAETGTEQLEVRITTRRDGKSTAPPTRVYLIPGASGWELLGLRRDD